MYIGEPSVAKESKRRLIEYLEEKFREMPLRGCREWFCKPHPNFSSILNTRIKSLNESGKVPECCKELFETYQTLAKLLDALIDEVGEHAMMRDIRNFPEKEAIELFLAIVGVDTSAASWHNEVAENKTGT